MDPNLNIFSSNPSKTAVKSYKKETISKTDEYYRAVTDPQFLNEFGNLNLEYSCEYHYFHPQMQSGSPTHFHFRISRGTRLGKMQQKAVDFPERTKDQISDRASLSR